MTQKYHRIDKLESTNTIFGNILLTANGNIRFSNGSVQTIAYPGPQDLSAYATNANLQTFQSNVGSFYTWANLNFGTGTSTYSNTDANALFTITNITAFADVDTTPPTVGQVLKWNGTKWAPGIDATSGGGGVDADTLDGQHGDYYLNYNNFSNVPDLSVYATNTSLNLFEANVGGFYTWANVHFGTSSYGDSNVATYLSAHSITPQLQSDYTQVDSGNVTYIKNKPDLSVYATNTALNTFEANVGSFYTWANLNYGTSSYANSNVASYLTSQGIAAQLQSDWNQATVGNVTYIKNKPDLTVYATKTALQTLDANVGAYQLWANSNVAGLSSSITTLTANAASQDTSIVNLWGNAAVQNTWLANLQANIYSNTNVASYLTSQSISAQLQSDWNQASTGNVTFIKNKPTNVSAFTNDAGYLTGTSLGSTTTIVQTANVAYYPNVTATTTAATFYPGMYNAASGNLATFTSANIQFNPGTGNLFLANGFITTSAATATIFNNTPTTVNIGGAATTINLGASGGNVNTPGTFVASGNVWANGGYFRTNATTAFIANTNPTTVYLAGGATIGTYIGNSAGTTWLAGNVQGSTNGFAIGYRDIPQLSLATNVLLSLSDAGKHYYATSGSYTITVPYNANTAFPVGTAINVINQSASSMTITGQAANVSIYLAGNATPSSRTLSSYGMATIQKVATDTWFLVGVGLS